MGKELVNVGDHFTQNEKSSTEAGDDSKGDVPRFSELFYRELPYYLSIGMSADEFWYGDTRLAPAYREADTLRQERFNAEAHLQAFYIYEVIADFVPVLVSFPKKGSKPAPFRTSPIDLELKHEFTKDHAKTEEEIEKEKMKHIEGKMFAFMERRRRAKEEEYGKNR